jgi:hypothetical protein
MKIKPLKSVRSGAASVTAYVNAVKNGQHVVPSNGDLAVKKANSEKATKIFDNQKEAIDYARKVAMNQQVELSIHGKNGQIREKASYGKDSFPPRG